MRRKSLIMILLTLFVSGCTITSSEKIESLEQRIETVEKRLASCEGRMDSCEGNVFSLSQRQDTVEESYRKFSEEKTKSSAASTAKSISNQEIQIALKNSGFYNGQIDGKIGPNTEKAIRAFQKANGLKADGVVGEMTKNLLIKQLPQASD